MNLKRFETILAAYGTSAPHWPANEAAAALTLLDQSKAAQTLLKQADQFQGLIDQAGNCGVQRVGDVTLIINSAIARIEGYERGKLVRTRGWSLPWLVPAGMAFGAMLAFSIGLGLGSDFPSAAGQADAGKLLIEGPYRSFASL